MIRFFKSHLRLIVTFNKFERLLLSYLYHCDQHSNGPWEDINVILLQINKISIDSKDPKVISFVQYEFYKWLYWISPEWWWWSCLSLCLKSCADRRHKKCHFSVADVFFNFMTTIWPLLNWVSFLEAAGAAVKIGLSPKLNHHKEIGKFRLPKSVKCPVICVPFLHSLYIIEFDRFGQFVLFLHTH